MKFAFHPDALVEFEGAARYYAAIQPELAQRFVDSIELAIAKLTAEPLGYAVLEQDVRRCLHVHHSCSGARGERRGAREEQAPSWQPLVPRD